MRHDQKPRFESEPEYVFIGDCASRLQMQSQYLSYYLKGYGGKPNLGEGVSYHGDFHNYHEISIHPDDVDEFFKRVMQHRES